MDITTIKARMAKVDFYPYFTKNQTELKYFLDYSGSNGYLLILDRDHFIFYTDTRYIEMAQSTIGREYVKLLDNMYTNPISSVISDFKLLGLQNIYLDFNLWTYQEFLKLEEQSQKVGVSFISIPSTIDRIRKVKDKSEVENIKKAQEIVEKSLFAVMGLLKEGVKERDISNEFDYLIRKNGAMGNSFSSIVVFGQNTSRPHGVPGDNILKKGDIVLFDVGALYNNYCSDMTRTFSFGEPSYKSFKQNYEILLTLQKGAILEVKENRDFADLDLYVRKGLEKENLAQYFTHSLGHGVGIDIHEIPRIYFEKKDERIQKGNVFTIEPGLYFEKEYGIRIEDLIYFNEKGQIESLSTFPKELIIL